MNWKNIKNLSKDDYYRPILLRIMDEGYDEPRYVSGYVMENGIEIWGGVEMIDGEQSVAIYDEPMPENAYYVRIDEIKY